MPVYWFALSQVREINWPKSVMIFVILHLLVYPASNGYNSYMDRDTTPVGGLSKPMQPTTLLFAVTLLMDALALMLSWTISPVFTIGIFFYILASRAYSYRKIRLKKYPVAGYLTVVVFQGAVTFFLVFSGSSSNPFSHPPVLAMIASSLLIGGFYPLTQIYQHQADYDDGVITISYLLGYKGTFVFTGIVYALAFGILGWYFYSVSAFRDFLILQICMLPILLLFLYWFEQVSRNKSNADFKNTMRMNVTASVFTNLGFIILLILNNTNIS